VNSNTKVDVSAQLDVFADALPGMLYAVNADEKYGRRECSCWATVQARFSYTCKHAIIEYYLSLDVTF
jgi:hypothetical protein